MRCELKFDSMCSSGLEPAACGTDFDDELDAEDAASLMSESSGAFELHTSYPSGIGTQVLRAIRYSNSLVHGFLNVFHFVSKQM